MKQQFWAKPLLCITALSVGILATAGCASGGFHLTREYAQWVNSKSIILRIILYILTAVVFAVTMLIDLVLFNTLDFWDGKVSQGEYQFKAEDKQYFVKHEILPGTLLKRSTINVFSVADHKQLQNVVISELASGDIEMMVDGKIRAHVKHISSLPVVSVYNQAGQFVTDQVLRITDNTTVVTAK